MPLKPDVCVIDGRLAVFIGADYKLLPPDAADRFVRKMQGELARLKRQEKRRLRDLKSAQGTRS
jgi:hypothetical protein